MNEDPDDLTNPYPQLNGLSVDLFTDRSSELAAFDAALTAHRDRIERPSLIGEPRINVLSFYGVGGVGKSALSKRLEDWSLGRLEPTDHWGDAPSRPPEAVARIDLHTSQGNFDVVAALIEIRTALADVKRSWPAFDIAMATYWSAARPGEKLPEGRGSDGRFATATGEVLANLANDLGSLNVVTGAGAALLRAAVRAARRSARLRSAVKDQPNFEAVLDLCSDGPTPADPHLEIAATIAAQLTFEIGRMEPADRPLLVVFVDTVERLRMDARGDSERLLNQLVYTMPYALFVLTGRNHLDWADQSRTGLFRSGPAKWPGLAAHADQVPAQHLVGKLAPEDRIALLRRARFQEGLDIADAVMAEISYDSNGLPLYLDLALEISRTMKRNGSGAVAASHVTGSLDSLVLRLMEDLPEDERSALRAACLLPFFDVELAASGGGVAVAAALRLVRRALIAENISELYHYRVHDEVRLAVRRADPIKGGGWAEPDWRSAAERALDQVKIRHDAASVALDQVATLDAVVLAVYLVAATGVTHEWVDSAILKAPSFGGIATRIPRHAENAIGQHYIDFIVAKARLNGGQQSREALARVASDSGPLSRAARRHHAYRLRDIGRWDEAIEEFAALAREASPATNNYHRAFTMIQARRFRDAQQAALALPPDRAAIIHATCGRFHGHLRHWVSHRRELESQYSAQHRQRELRETRAMRLRYQTWFDRSITDDVQLELDRSEEAGNDVAVKAALAALGNLAAGNQPAVWEITERVVRAMANDEVPQTARVAEPRALDAFVRRDLTAAAEVHAYAMAMSVPRDVVWIPTEILLEDMGCLLYTSPSPRDGLLSRMPSSA